MDDLPWDKIAEIIVTVLVLLCGGEGVRRGRRWWKRRKPGNKQKPDQGSG